MIKINLAGNWIMKNCTDGKEYNAVIPGSDFGNLIKNRAIKNPLISGDEKEGIRIGENDFEFKRQFTLTAEDLKYSHINLLCKGLDTLCTCYINGREAFKSSNAFIPIDIDIKNFLIEGENSILLHFYSAVKYINKLQKDNPLPKNSNGIDGIAYIRKPSCHFGWDWGPCIPYCAVLENIELKCFNNRIENIKITQTTTKEKSIVNVTADNADIISLVCPDGDVLTIDENNIFEIDNPKLWYTRELSQRDRQPLYTVIFENDEEKVERKIGLRSLYLDTDKDEYGSNFCFVLNG